MFSAYVSFTYYFVLLADVGRHEDEGQQGAVPAATSQSEPVPSTTSTLRSRFNPTSGLDPTQSDSQSSSGPEEPAESSGNLISVRLIKSANESITARISPTTTLHQLRRYIPGSKFLSEEF